VIGKMPAWFSLGVTVSLIAGGVLYSLWKTRNDTETEAKA
jgi:tellurite resistance protein TerC